jgi:hypothetical protein
MRTAALPNFRKSWGRLENGLKKGQYYLLVDNFYDVSKFDGTKKFVITNNNVIGGKNQIMSGCYLGLGVSCFIFAIFFGSASIYDKENN